MGKRLITFLLLLSALGLGAQNVSDLVISEALAQPDSSGILDGYGRCGGWLELYNKSTGTVNFGGCYLTDDRSFPTRSLIPKSDLRTKLGPRQTVLFYCSGNGADGTFYTGFTLAPGKTVYLVSNDGHSIIDSLAIPAGLPKGRSVQKRAADLRLQCWEVFPEPCQPSPGMLNTGESAASKGDQMKARDPHGWILSVVSVSVVFSALAILWFLFWLLFDRPAKKKMTGHESLKRHVPLHGADNGAEIAAAIALAMDMEADGDTYAAIAAAVHLYLSETVHDRESGILTIRRTESAWSNKALNFRKLHR